MSVPSEFPGDDSDGSPRTTVLNRGVSKARPFLRYSVVGLYADRGATFVRHVALLAANMKLPADSVPVWHMGPPIALGVGRSPETALNQVDVVSDVGITPHEEFAMDDWRALVASEERPPTPFRHYIAHPPCDWVRDTSTGHRLYRRFSCVGFVVSCYEAAGIHIFDLSGAFPRVDEATLLRAYPDVARVERWSVEAQRRIGYLGREDLGLSNDAMWPLVLAGYVFHALARANRNEPRPPAYVPKGVAEAEFP